jgi:hypothetical protein
MTAREVASLALYTLLVAVAVYAMGLYAIARGL